MLSHRFGPPEYEHSDADHHDHSAGEAHPHENAARGPDSWDAFIELGGEWDGRQKVDGAMEAESGGKWLYVAPGVRFTSASGWSVGAAVAVPLWQDIRASHPDHRYRVMLSLGRTF